MQNLFCVKINGSKRGLVKGFAEQACVKEGKLGEDMREKA